MESDIYVALIKRTGTGCTTPSHIKHFALKIPFNCLHNLNEHLHHIGGIMITLCTIQSNSVSDAN